METSCLKISFFSILALLFTSILLIINNHCSSQQINDYKDTANINFNKFEKSEVEQSLREEKSEKIIKLLKINLKEKQLLIEIKQLSAEAKQCLKDANFVSKEINKISDENNINNLKNDKKIKRQKNYELSLRYDAEELFEISNSLLFNIYENHFPTNEVLLAKENKNQQQIIDLNKDAQELFKKAEDNQDKSTYNLKYKEGLDYLKRVNILKREAIKKYEYAYSLYYNIPINIDEYNTLIAELNINIPNENKTESDSLNINNDKQDIPLSSSDSTINNEQVKLNEMIVYRVQIGAFRKKVDINDFHGLYPLTEDKKDQKEFIKFMVGKYFSYKAANEAKRIIVSTTKYQDAFIVAYKNDVRVDVNNELIK